MEAQDVINVLFAACGALGGFILKNIWDALQLLRSDLAALQQSIANNYVRKDDFRDHAARVEGLLREIRDDLKHKVDKE
jgi:hypothetical protein